MNRETLIERLQDAVKREESATSIYVKHLSAIVSRSGLPAADISRIQDSLQYLIHSNKEHKGYLLSLIERIRGEEKDVF